MASSIHFSSLTTPVPLRKPKSNQWRERHTSLLTLGSSDTNIDGIGFIGIGWGRSYKCKHHKPLWLTFFHSRDTGIDLTASSPVWGQEHIQSGNLVLKVKRNSFPEHISSVVT